MIIRPLKVGLIIIHFFHSSLFVRSPLLTLLFDLLLISENLPEVGLRVMKTFHPVRVLLPGPPACCFVNRIKILYLEASVNLKERSVKRTLASLKLSAQYQSEVLFQDLDPLPRILSELDIGLNPAKPDKFLDVTHIDLPF